jgi:hypothetical protein
MLSKDAAVMPTVAGAGRRRLNAGGRCQYDLLAHGAIDFANVSQIDNAFHKVRLSLARVNIRAGAILVPQ